MLQHLLHFRTEGSQTSPPHHTGPGQLFIKCHTTRTTTQRDLLHLDQAAALYNAFWVTSLGQALCLGMADSAAQSTLDLQDLILKEGLQGLDEADGAQARQHDAQVLLVDLQKK